MPIKILSNGEEILLDTIDFPPPNDDLFMDNPYKIGSKQSNKWISIQKANYYNKCYRERVKAEENKIQLALLPDAKDLVSDPKLWQIYLISQGLQRDPHKHYLRKYNPTAKKKPKRSDAMKLMLEENGYRVVDEIVLDPSGRTQGRFLANGKIELQDGQRISAHKFLNS